MKTERPLNDTGSISSTDRLTEIALNRVFRDGRTFNAFHDRPVSDELLNEALELANCGPTAFNALPMRVVFIRTKEGRERLRPAMSPGNVDKTMIAPVIAVIAFDTHFYEHLPRLFPFADVKGIFDSAPELAQATAARNGTLQAGYFILALRTLGLDAGPMSGFDPAAVNAAFFPDGRFQTNIIINIGYGDRSTLPPRAPRFSANEVASYV